MEIIPELAPSLLLTLPFFVTLIALYVILWQPLLDYLASREAHTTGARATAADLEAKADVALTDVEQTLAQTFAEAKAIRQEHRKQANKEEAAIIAAARQAADARIAEALETLRGERKEASEALRASASGLSDAIVANLLAETPTA